MFPQCHVIQYQFVVELHVYVLCWVFYENSKHHVHKKLHIEDTLFYMGLENQIMKS